MLGASRSVASQSMLRRHAYRRHAALRLCPHPVGQGLRLHAGYLALKCYKGRTAQGDCRGMPSVASAHTVLDNFWIIFNLISAGSCWHIALTSCPERIVEAVCGGHAVRCQRSHCVGHILRVHVGFLTLSSCTQHGTQAACWGHVGVYQRPHCVGQCLRVHAGCLLFSGFAERVARGHAYKRHVEERLGTHGPVNFGEVPHADPQLVILTD
jgi:hypothetical protein